MTPEEKILIQVKARRDQLRGTVRTHIQEIVDLADSDFDDLSSEDKHLLKLLCHLARIDCEINAYEDKLE